MKFYQEFKIGEPVSTLWAFFDQPEIVAQCMPGVERIETLDQDNFRVEATQRVGPISATFESRVRITEKVAPERIAFSATGKAVRGAIGNFRAESVVTLHPGSDGTLVRVESEVALAGVLGSVGQKIIARQAEKITAEFAANLQRRMHGESAMGMAPAAVGVVPGQGAATSGRVGAAGMLPSHVAGSVAVRSDRWGLIAVIISAVNLAIGIRLLMALG